MIFNLTYFTIGNMQYLAKLSQYIRNRRKSLGISLNQFCIENEIDSSCLSKFENQKQQVLILTLVKIANGFGQSLAEFLTEFEKELKND